MTKKHLVFRFIRNAVSIFPTSKFLNQAIVEERLFFYEYFLGRADFRKLILIPKE